MDHFKVFDDKLIHKFNFKGEYIGYVLDNSNFEKDLRVKLFIPELFSYQYNPSIKNIDSTINLSTEHLINDDINITTELNKQEYIFSRPLIHREDIYSTKENFLKCYKPEVGDKVIVFFFNENPNNCVYKNMLFATNGESITLGDGTVFSSRPETIDTINKRNNKVTWNY